MRVALNFGQYKDTDCALKLKTIGVSIKKYPNLFPKPPLDLDQYLSLVDAYSKAIVVAADGSRTAISQRNKLRMQATKMGTYLGYYVGDVAGNDLEIVYAGGLEPANKVRLLPKPLPKTGLKKVERGPNSGTALAYIQPISRARHGKVAFYQLGYAQKNGNEIGELTIIPTRAARFPITIKNLIPATTYVFLVRAINSNKHGFTDWSDPFFYIAT